MSAHARPQIVTLDPAVDAAALRALRLACATDTAGDTGGAEWDALDPLSLHLAARTDDGRLIASVRLTADRRLDRLGVLPGWRRRGVADQLL
ncbi:GNAT family N-acetyltransferase, partial [Xanthomonas phaseoli]